MKKNIEKLDESPIGLHTKCRGKVYRNVNEPYNVRCEKCKGDIPEKEIVFHYELEGKERIDFEKDK